jgi:glycerol transport system substrate-binding protein
MAPTPKGAYWQEGMKLGYQDCGSWTLLESTPVERRKMAWLYAQFCVAKSVSLKKTLVGLTPIRESDIRSEAMTEAAPRLGGLVEFYRSPARVLWTPTGTNVPDYPLLSQLWWQVIAAGVAGRGTPEEIMDQLATRQDDLLGRLGQVQATECSPVLNEPEDPQVWLDRPGAPKPKLADEEGEGRTVPYEELLQTWRQA